MTISAMHMAVLRSVADRGEVSLRKISETYRQRLIDLGMQEPPLVAADGERVTLTTAGAKLLAIEPHTVGGETDAFGERLAP